jgi:hypothetical protein
MKKLLTVLLFIAIIGALAACSPQTSALVAALLRVSEVEERGRGHAATVPEETRSKLFQRRLPDDNHHLQRPGQIG